MNTWRVPPQAPKTPEELDPYRFPGLRGFERNKDRCFQNSPPNANANANPSQEQQEPASRISATDHRRLDLHAALTAAGIPPRAGDLRAIEAVSALDDAVNAAIQRWITGAR
ncbi:hypothetical protein ABT083_26770 [Streptomyces goshikiensis]|uniref:hypothetical protein n=1 Tax=Streptomyces TaxID=1883 RepID=UPI00093CE7AB|nr:hypothetical protein [Streptomyces sp. CB03578]OKI26434.1 hypothetical protein A6A28_15610 [Streptomyces sp. CB03578]